MATNLLVALVTAGVSLVAVGAIVLVRRRRRSKVEEDRVDAAVRAVTAGVDLLVHQLTEELERAREEARRSRYFGRLAGTLDLDRVADQTLVSALEATAGDAVVVRLGSDDGEQFSASRGLSDDEADAYRIDPPPARARSMTFLYEYGDIADEVVYGGAAVPLEVEGERIGVLGVFTRSATHAFDRDAMRRLEELAEQAGPALENARLFRDARERADLDSLTGLHNRRYFHETLGRECRRAKRYGRRLAVLIADLDGFKTANERIGHLAADCVLADVAERISGVVRGADVACRVGGDEFAVILPEAGLQEAEQLGERLQQAIASTPFGGAGRVSVSTGAAELAPPDDASSLFERADEALYRAKGREMIVAQDPARASPAP